MVLNTGMCPNISYEFIFIYFLQVNFSYVNWNMSFMSRKFYKDKNNKEMKLKRNNTVDEYLILDGSHFLETFKNFSFCCS